MKKKIGLTVLVYTTKVNKRVGWIACLSLLLMAVGQTQEIPDGVRYKKASEEVNKKATACLRKLLNVKVPDKVILASLEDAVTCGPSLWSTIKKTAPSSLQKAAKALFVLPNASGTQELEGRVARKDEERRQLWLHVLAIDNKYKKSTIRKAKSSEISYYWAIIPYDIEEPVLIADYGKVKLLFHFRMEKDQPRVFFAEIVP